MFKGLIKRIDSLFYSRGKVSSKRFAFITVVLSSVSWLSVELASNGMTDNWINAFNVLVVSVIGGYVGGVALEKKDKITHDE